MRLALISDTHMKHRELVVPEADVLIHAGDLTGNGELETIADFADWALEQPVKQRIVIGGNHDWCLDPTRSRYNAAAESFFHRAGIHYLFDSSISLDGVTFYGTPWVPNLPGWAFHRQSSMNPYTKIPRHTNVLITHAPPYGILDAVPSPTVGWGGTTNYINYGCPCLLQRIHELRQLQLVVCGHVHPMGHRVYPPVADHEGLTFINACSMDADYNIVHPPFIYDLP